MSLTHSFRLFALAALLLGPVIGARAAEQLVPGWVLCGEDGQMAPRHPYMRSGDICWNIAHELNGPNGHYWRCRPVTIPSYFFN